MADPAQAVARQLDPLAEVARLINDAVGALLTEDGIPARDSEIACDHLDEAQQILSKARRALTDARREEAAAIFALVDAIQVRRGDEMPPCTDDTGKDCECDYHSGAFNGLNEVLTLLRQRAAAEEHK